jgi:cellulose synthase/poly-beta-1,6-N-acetylglucosamine synthase-like glycosyltransferase
VNTILLLLAPVAAVLALPGLLAVARLARGTVVRPPAAPLGDDPPRLVVLVPAHDEEELIGECVGSLLNQDYPEERRRVVVIADNCTDATLSRAAAAGANTMERQDPSRPGKPQALAWAVSQLSLAEFDAIVIVDADTVADRGFLRGLSVWRPMRGVAVQGYFATRNEWDNWLTRLAGLLARARYEVLYPQRQRAGFNVPLTGNGMALGCELLSNPWSAFSLTEDLELYASLTAGGHRIRYSREAVVYSQEARTLRQGRTQRERWGRGRVAVLRHAFAPLVRSSEASPLEKLDALVELASPSPAIRLALSAAVLLLTWFFLDGAAAWMLAVAAILFVAPDAIAIVIALSRHPQRLRTLAALAFLPGYIGWRILVAMRAALISDDSEWKKTTRNAAPS